MGTRDDEILAALQELLANQREAVAMQKAALEMQQQAVACQAEAIAQQKLAVARQLAHLRLYRMVLIVALPLVAVLVAVFLRIAGPYL